MKSTLFLPLLAAGAALIQISAEEPKKPDTPTTEAAPPKDSAKPDEKKADEKKDPKQSELEAKFKTTLTNATMSGRWCMVKDNVMEPDKEEKYTISSVTQLWGERWLIHSRIQYGTRDVTVPVPVKVKWAGDTAVITVDDFGLPGGASYSARVLIYGNTYAGTWSGPNVGGLLHGLITQDKPGAKAPEKPADKPAEKSAEKPAPK